MPITTNCLRAAGFIGLLAGVGCSATTPHQTAEIKPVEEPSAIAAALPTSMGLASQSRDIAMADSDADGTVITEVAYAAPIPASESLAAIGNAVAEKGDRVVLPDAAQQSQVAAVVESRMTTSNASASTPQMSVEVASLGEDTPLTVLPPPTKPTGIAAFAGATPTVKEDRFAPPSKPAPMPVILASLGDSEISGPVKASSPELDTLIARYAQIYEVPLELVRRVVKRESTFNPGARNGPYWGLMQIRHDTAKGMGYKGSASGLLDAETNLTYAVKYLRGAFLTAGGNHDQAVRYYSRGYYYDAKKRGLLEKTGLKTGKSRKSDTPVMEAKADLPDRSIPTPTTATSIASLPGVAANAGGSVSALGFASEPSAASIGISGAPADNIGNSLR